MKKYVSLFLTLLLCVPLLMGACGGGGESSVKSTNSEYNSVDTPISIPDKDLNGISSYINIAGIGGTISKVTVDLYITHTYDYDLDVYLVSPDNTPIVLFSAIQEDGDNFEDTRFDDAAGTSIYSGSAPFNGSYRPDMPLSTFNGEDPNGEWELIVVDFEEDDTGILRAWGLNID